MIKQPSDSLIQRALVGGIAIVLFLLIVYFAHAPKFGWLFLGVLMLVISVALWEYYEMAVAMQFRPMIRTGIWGAAMYLLACWAQIIHPQLSFLPQTILFILLVIAIVLQLTGDVGNPLPNLGVTIFGIAYIVLPLACILYITYYPFRLPAYDGRWWLLYLVFVTKMTDIGGFAIGKLFGKHPLAPFVSPKKTVEGAAGGALFAVLASFGVSACAMIVATPGPLGLTLLESVVLGLVISIAAQLGDLAESMLKRNAGIKDSSHLPGLGGVLDIMDSMIFTAPLIYLYLCAAAVR